jgi:nicotinamidase-related amidase
MFKITQNGSNRLDIEMNGKLNADQMKIALDELMSKSKNIENRTMGDSFLRTDLEEKLVSLKIKNLVICRYASEYCIDNTTRRATGLGYTVQLVFDAHTTHDKAHLTAEKIREHHNVTLSMGPTISTVQSKSVSIEG